MNQANPDSNLKVSSAETFKKIRESRLGRVVKLPSGLVVKVGKPQISDMLEAGDIPGELINTALGVRSSGTTDIETAKKSSKMMKYIICKALIEPKCLLKGEPNYDKGEIHIQDLSDSDRIFLYSYVQEGVVAQLEKFRDDSTGKDGGSGSTPLPGDEAKPTDGDSERVGSVPSGRSTGEESPRRGSGSDHGSGSGDLRKSGDQNKGQQKNDSPAPKQSK